MPRCRPDSRAPHRVVGEDPVRLMPVVDECDDVVVDTVCCTRVRRLRLTHRLGEKIPVDVQHLLGIVLDSDREGEPSKHEKLAERRSLGRCSPVAALPRV